MPKKLHDFINLQTDSSLTDEQKFTELIEPFAELFAFYQDQNLNEVGKLTGIHPNTIAKLVYPAANNQRWLTCLAKLFYCAGYKLKLEPIEEHQTTLS